jgi:HPt (histidine-containing phosphotransfer) domain-containing protein
MPHETAAMELAPPVTHTGAQAGGRTDILHAAALDSIRALQKPNKPNLLEKIVRFYLGDAPRLVQRMADAVSTQDFDALQGAAHTLKSSSANLGALALAELCKEMEEEARGKSLPLAAARMVRIEHEFGLVRAALRARIGESAHD